MRRALITNFTSSFAILGSLLFLMPFASTAHAAKYKNLNLGAWKGGIYASNKTGNFSHCVVSAKYKSGITLLFSVTKGLKWQVGFSKPAWNLTVGDKYPVKYQVDKRRTHSGEANAVSKKLAIIYLPGSSKLFSEMRRGRLLRVKTEDDLLSFRLTGTSKMLRQLLACARKYDGRNLTPVAKAPSSNSNSKNPFAGSNNQENQTAEASKPRRKSGITPQFRREAKVWFDAHLAASSERYSIVPNKGSAQKMYRKHALVWRVGKKTGIIGSLRIFPRKKAEALENNVMAFEARSCKGDFASKYFKHDGVGSAPASRLLATCRQDSGKTWSTYYAITNRDDGGTYLVSLISNSAPSEAVVDAGEQLTGDIQTSGGAKPVGETVEDDLPFRDEEADKVKEF